MNDDLLILPKVKMFEMIQQKLQKSALNRERSSSSQKTWKTVFFFYY